MKLAPPALRVRRRYADHCCYPIGREKNQEPPSMTRKTTGFLYFASWTQWMQPGFNEEIMMRSDEQTYNLKQKLLLAGGFNPFPRHPRTLESFGEISWVVRNRQHPNTNVPRWSLSEVSISLCLTSNNMDEPGKSSFVIRTAHTTCKCLLFFNNSLQTGNTG